MTRPLLLLIGVLAGALPAAETAGVRIRPVWWQQPAQAPQLYAAGDDGQPRPVRVLAMCPLESIQADPAKGAQLLRRIEPDPADPKSKVRWVPFATAALPPDSRDLLMLLFPSADGAGCQTRLLAMDEDKLRWGGTRLVNFTPDRLVGLVDNKPFAIAAGDSAILPFVAARRAVVDVVIATENPRGRTLIFSSKGIFGPSKRTVLFVLRNGSGGHETRAIEEPNPDPNAHEASESGR